MPVSPPPDSDHADLWLFISDQTAGTTLAVDTGVALSTLLPQSSLSSDSVLAYVGGTPFSLYTFAIQNYINQAESLGDQLWWAVEGVNYTSSGTRYAPGTVVGIANFAAGQSQFAEMSFLDLAQWANDGRILPVPYGGFEADVYYLINTYTAGGTPYSLAGVPIGAPNAWGVGLGNIGGSVNLYDVGPDQSGNALGQSTTLLAATGNGNNNRVQSYYLGTISLLGNGRLFFTPVEVPAPPSTDGPLPLWALGALGAGLFGIASMRLKRRWNNFPV